MKNLQSSPATDKAGEFCVLASVPETSSAADIRYPFVSADQRARTSAQGSQMSSLTTSLQKYSPLSASFLSVYIALYTVEIPQ